MRILSWNVNGIRAVLRKGFTDFLQNSSFDALFLQEIKIAQRDIEKENLGFPGFQVYWNPATRPGYSGTAVLIPEDRSLPQKVWSPEEDEEGRVQFLEFEDFYAVNAYFPNSGPKLERLDFKLDFDRKLHQRLRELKKGKPVLLGGDLNVAHEEIDIARPEQNRGNAGFTDEERKWMTGFLDSGFVDTFRKMHPETVKYSWWTYRAQARKRNVGWRLDYFCVSGNFYSKVKNSFIWNEIYGSDHCPVGVDLF